jgi:azurin
MPTPLTKASPAQVTEQRTLTASSNTNEQLQQADIQLKVKEKRRTATKKLRPTY